MRRVLASLPRLAVVSVLMLTLTALGLARLAPSSSPQRFPSRSCKVLINHQPGLWWPAEAGMLWLDAETGQTTRVPLLGQPMLQAASLSPWHDDRGRSQIVGFRSRGINKGGIVLERSWFPDGAALDAIETDVFPCGSLVCWYPGTRARVLFAGSGMRLYQFEFERDARAGRGGVADGPMDRPRPLVWNGPDPLSCGTWFGDLHWPADPRFAHLVLSCSHELDRQDRPGRGGLAWLRLDERGDSAEEWGCLLDPSALPPGSRVRGPALGVATDGRLLLAYYESREGWHWNLRMTPMALAPDGRPRTVTEPGRVVAEGCLCAIPAAFSRDGRLVNVVIVGPGGSPVVRRIDVDALWKSPPAPRPRARSAGARSDSRWEGLPSSRLPPGRSAPRPGSNSPGPTG